MPQRQGGFTLVELLIVLVLVGLISGALAGGIRFGVQALERGEARWADLARTGAALHFLRTRLAEAQPLVRTDGEAAGIVAFIGGPTEMAFVTLAPPFADRVPLYEFRVALAGGTLVAQWAPHHFGGVPFTGWSEDRAVPLCAADGLRFAYFGALAAGEPALWHDSWTGAATLPQSVMVRVEPGAGCGSAGTSLIRLRLGV